MDDRQVRLSVVGVRVELPSNQPVLILRGAAPEDRKHHVAILVGPAEAAAVARALQGETPVRPMTHDLLAESLELLGGGVVAIELGLLDPSTYFGSIRLGTGQVLDARASDAVALAVRVHCPVTMSRETLLEVSVSPRYSPSARADQETDSPAVAGAHEGLPNRRGPISEEEIRQFHKFLDEAGPEDFKNS